MEDRKPYTVQELADRWSCSRTVIYDLVDDGRLQHFRIGPRMIRIPAPVVAGKRVEDFFALDRRIVRPKAGKLAKSLIAKIMALPPPSYAGSVYFIKCGKYVKIGFSEHPPSRMGNLQSSNPHPMELLGSIRGTRVEERALHIALTSMRHQREWFRLDSRLRAAILELCDANLDR